MALILFFNFVRLAILIRHKTQLFASGRYRNREEAAFEHLYTEISQDWEKILQTFNRQTFLGLVQNGRKLNFWEVWHMLSCNTTTWKGL